MRALLSAVLLGLARREKSFSESDCIIYTPDDQWCMSEVQCSDKDTGEKAFFSRIRKMPNYEAVDTSVVDASKRTCEAFNATLPTVHSDLENWCAFHAGLYGTKGLVPLGARVNSSFSKGWSWEDGSATNYDRLDWGDKTAETIEGWCIRVDLSLKWSPWPCDTSAYHNQKDFISCGPQITPEPTPMPTEIPTELPTFVPTEIPTELPTFVPTEIPTELPTFLPTEDNESKIFSIAQTQKTTQKEESGAYVYWAAPGLAIVIIIIFLVYKRVQGSRHSVEKFNYKLQSDVEPPSMAFQLNNTDDLYQYDGSIAGHEDSSPEYSIATGDNVSVGSEDSQGYLKPAETESEEKEDNSVVVPGEYDVALEVAEEGTDYLAVNTEEEVEENDEITEFGLDFSELEEEMAKNEDEEVNNTEAVYSVATSNISDNYEYNNFGI